MTSVQICLMRWTHCQHLKTNGEGLRYPGNTTHHIVTHSNQEMKMYITATVSTYRKWGRTTCWQMQREDDMKDQIKPQEKFFFMLGWQMCLCLWRETGSGFTDLWLHLVFTQHVMYVLRLMSVTSSCFTPSTWLELTDRAIWWLTSVQVKT